MATQRKYYCDCAKYCKEMREVPQRTFYNHTKYRSTNRQPIDLGEYLRKFGPVDPIDTVPQQESETVEFDEEPLIGGAGAQMDHTTDVDYQMGGETGDEPAIGRPDENG